MTTVPQARTPLPRARARALTPALRLTLTLAFALPAALPPLHLHAQEDPFAANVRPTDPRTPADQRSTFRVPEGFEVQLVAHEPDIHKPMNLAFDADGRLWVTTSREYPYPVPAGQPGRDRVMIFEDFAPDGRARKITTFADGLNIPIGVYPFRTDTRGWKALVWSIPHIWLMEDLDGDGRADSRKPLYGPFDHTRDTHGNQASFRRGFDGWLYATHGFNNDSHVAGRDGHRVHFNSGNTYRIRLDGNRIESFTRGQVNPFGLAFDPAGDLYSSDCHSDPIYLLLPGGNYPSFGKPHDGLGFAPNMMEQVRGSTAIDGISYYADDLWPREYHDCVFIGDVMTSRVYRDLAARRGSGRVTRAQPDFIISDDPWFRPVDTTLGPDGALYVADFYNRIIGHYEVPLDHPGRDRERGRIWRVVHRGNPLRSPALPDSLQGLIAELASPSLPRRLLATQEIADRFAPTASEPLQTTLANPANPFQLTHTLWLARRLGFLKPESLATSAQHPDENVRIHALRIAADILADAARGASVAPGLLNTADQLALTALADPAPPVQRAAVEAIASRPQPEHLQPLLDFIPAIPTNDLHLRYSARRALRNLLDLQPILFSALADRDAMPERDVRTVLDVCLAVKSEAAARFLLRHRPLYAPDPAFTQAALTHASRHAAPADIDRLVATLDQNPSIDLDFQTGIFRSLLQGSAQRGSPPNPSVLRWGAKLAQSLLASVASSASWWNQPLDDARNKAVPWDYQDRPTRDGSPVRLMSSFPRGETLTGSLRSRTFPAPPALSFLLAGHDGHPDQPPGHRNAVRLRDAQTDAVLLEAFAPRSDVAQPVAWSLTNLLGKPVYLEATDADTGGAFAWLAFGRFHPDPVPLPSIAPATVVSRQLAAAEIAAATADPSLKTLLAPLAIDPACAPNVRATVFRLLNASPLARAAADLVADDSLPHSWRVRVANVLFHEDRPNAEELIAETWRSAPYRFQVRFAALAASSPDLTADLVGRMADGRAPAGLLQDRRLQDRLRQAASDPTRATLDRLTRDLPSEDDTLQKLINDRRNLLRAHTPSLTRGKDLYAAACAACHQIDGQGGLVGPQLNGIGTRGEERLLEDILAPNRNVDRAFWTTALTLKDGESVSGLFRREEGELLILANAAGTETSIPKSDIAERRETNTSIMPSNFGEALGPEDFNDLLAYLLSLRGNP